MWPIKEKENRQLLIYSGQILSPIPSKAWRLSGAYQRVKVTKKEKACSHPGGGTRGPAAPCALIGLSKKCYYESWVRRFQICNRFWAAASGSKVIPLCSFNTQSNSFGIHQKRTHKWADQSLLDNTRTPKIMGALPRLLVPVRMRCYGSLININPSGLMQTIKDIRLLLTDWQNRTCKNLKAVILVFSLC